MKKIIAGILIGLAALPIFASGEFGLNEENGQCIVNEVFEYERRCLYCQVYLEENYPELSEEGQSQVISTISE